MPRGAWLIAGVVVLGALLAPRAPADSAPKAAPKRPAPAAAQSPSPHSAENPALPALLSGTGLYLSGSTSQVAPENWAYSPQYPLWSDGAVKRRWIRVPAGTPIDASNPEEWQFPVGTRFWKEFSFAGERVETRFLERLSDGSYRYASYVWDAVLGDARLAPEGGVLGVSQLAPGVQHDVPSRSDCRVCHEGRRTPVLGFRALQLSADRDPMALHAEAVPPGALDLGLLLQRGLLARFPQEWLTRAPRIQAPSPTARAAAGYFYGNCAHCHNARTASATLDLNLDPSITSEAYLAMLDSVLRHASHYHLPGAERSQRVVPGKPSESALWFRVQSRFPAAQMPPLGTKLVDRDAVGLIDRFIHQL